MSGRIYVYWILVIFGSAGADLIVCLLFEIDWDLTFMVNAFCFTRRVKLDSLDIRICSTFLFWLHENVFTLLKIII